MDILPDLKARGLIKMSIKNIYDQLYEAVRADNILLIEKLLKNKLPNLNSIPKKNYPVPLLTVAVSSSKLETISKLMELGLNPNNAPYFFRLPICVAAQRGDPKIFNFLIENGAELRPYKINEKFKSYVGIDGIAIESGSSEIIKILLDRDFSVNRFDNWDGQTPLALVAEEGNVRMVKFLLDLGASVDIKRMDGRTPLQAAIVYNLECYESDMICASSHQEVVKELLQSGANPCVDDGKETILRSARRLGNQTIISLIEQYMQFNKSLSKCICLYLSLLMIQTLL